MTSKFDLTIISAESKVFEGEVVNVLVPGMIGDFLVLSNHAPCISSIRPGFLEFAEGTSKKQRYFVSGGIIEVINNTVSVRNPRRYVVEPKEKNTIKINITDNTPDNTDNTNINTRHIIYNVYSIIQEQNSQQKRFKTKRLKQPKFNTKKYHNIHQPGRTNCDQRSRV